MEECAKWNILKVIKMNGIIVRIHHDHAIILIIMVINWCDARGEQQAVRGGEGGSWMESAFSFLILILNALRVRGRIYRQGNRDYANTLFNFWGVFSRLGDC